MVKGPLPASWVVTGDHHATFITYAFFMIIGMIVLLLDLYRGVAIIVSVANALWLAVRGTSTMGTVSRILEREPGRATEVQVAYETPEGTFTVEGTSELPWKGSPVPIRYNPAKPSQATTLVRPWAQATFKVPLVLLIAISAAGLIISGYWYFSRSHAPLQETLLTASGALGMAMLIAGYASPKYAILLHSRRTAQVDGTVVRYAERTRLREALLISFPTAEGTQEFYVRAGSALALSGDIAIPGDTVSVRYSPGWPATTATVKALTDVRFSAAVSTLLWVACAAAAVYIYSGL